MVLKHPASYQSEAFDWRKREEEFKAQLAEVGVIENRDYVQDTSRIYREDSRPFVVDGVAKQVYVLLKVPQSMIEKPIYKKADGQDIIFAMDAAKLATEITPQECKPSDKIYLEVADNFLCSVLQQCVNTQAHNKVVSTDVTRQLNTDLINIMQISQTSFFELPKYKLAYCSLYYAMCREKTEKTTRSGLLSIFLNTPLFNAYAQLMEFYTRDFAPNLRTMRPESMLEICHSHVACLQQSSQASLVGER
jgi:hypothetical protein